MHRGKEFHENNLRPNFNLERINFRTFLFIAK